MTCPHCSSNSKQLQKEVKYWKDRYFVEKKSLSCIVQWVLGVFGFTVKVDVDKESLGIRIEGRENKEALSSAVFPPTMTDNKITLLMEDRMVSEDFLEDPEEIAGLELALASSEVGQVDPLQFQVQGSNQGEIDKTAPQEQTQVHHQDAQAILDILRSYEDPTGQQQPSYIILKDGNQAIPVQLDCTQFLNGEFSTATTSDSGSGDKNTILPDSQQIVYRLTTGELANATITNPTLNKTTTAADTSKEKAAQSQPQSHAPPNKKPKTGQPDAASSPNRSSTTTTDDIKIGGPVFHKGSEFGLTLREKAQVYVQTKAVEVIKKTSQGFTCVQCSEGYCFTSVENALTHTKTHFEGRPYKCELCEETFAIQKVFLQHRKSHYPSRKPSFPKTTTKPPVFLSPRNANTPVIPANKISEPVGIKPPTKDSLSNKEMQSFGQPGPGNRNKQFKCTVPKCEWSYALANELEWHMKAHSQSRV